MDLSAGAEAFASAVSELAEGPGAIQQRLNRASSAALSRVDATQLPADLRPRVEALTSQLGPTPITRTMMSDDTAGAAAKEIVSIAFELCRRAASGAD